MRGARLNELTPPHPKLNGRGLKGEARLRNQRKMSSLEEVAEEAKLFKKDRLNRKGERRGDMEPRVCRGTGGRGEHRMGCYSNCKNVEVRPPLSLLQLSHLPPVIELQRLLKVVKIDLSLSSLRFGI